MLEPAELIYMAKDWQILPFVRFRARFYATWNITNLTVKRETEPPIQWDPNNVQFQLFQDAWSAELFECIHSQIFALFEGLANSKFRVLNILQKLMHVNINESFKFIQTTGNISLFSLWFRVSWLITFIKSCTICRKLVHIISMFCFQGVIDSRNVPNPL